MDVCKIVLLLLIRWLTPVTGQVGVMVSQVVERHSAGCHLLLITAAPHSPVFVDIIRNLVAMAKVVMVVSPELHRLPEALFHGSTTTCRSVVLHLLSDSNETGSDTFEYANFSSSDVALRLLEQAELWTLPETRVVVVGGRKKEKEVLLHHSLRNTINALYLALHHYPAASITPAAATTTTTTHTRLASFVVRQALGATQGISVYRRCLYCKRGNADYIFYGKVNATSLHSEIDSIFRSEESVSNFNGHQLKIISVTYFPYVDYTKNSDVPGSEVTLRDSLDFRLLEAFGRQHNFTYEVREEPNKSWGLLQDGGFTGMTGFLQREESDLCTVTAPSPKRFQAMNFLRGYPSDKMTIVSLKPSHLPHHLALITTFSEEVWVWVIVGVVLWGLTLWVLQLMWGKSARGKVISLQNTMLFCWGALLEESLADPSVSFSGQAQHQIKVLVGWGLVFCLVLSTGFKTSLTADLSVQRESCPVESFKDLVEHPGWGWAVEPWLLAAIPYEYLSQHSDPIVQTIFENMETIDANEALRKVTRGGYALIDQEAYISTYIASYHTDGRGKTPFLISKKGVSTMAVFGWGTRRGAPFFPHFQELMQRLEDSGLVSKWLEEVTNGRVKENRQAMLINHSPDLGENSLEGERRELLGMNNLQGALYMLFLGSGVAVLTLFAEILTSHTSQRKTCLPMKTYFSEEYTNCLSFS